MIQVKFREVLGEIRGGSRGDTRIWVLLSPVSGGGGGGDGGLGLLLGGGGIHEFQREREREMVSFTRFLWFSFLRG